MLSSEVVFIKNSVMFKTWLKLEASKSSTWREIKAVALCLLSFKDVLKGSSVPCYTDSQNAVIKPTAGVIAIILPDTLANVIL
jgi:hypothetical protein